MTFKRKAVKFAVVSTIFVFAYATPVSAWQLDTHTWVSQEGYDVVDAMGEDDVTGYLDGFYGSSENAKYYLGFYGMDEDHPQGGGTANLDNDIEFDAWWTYSRNGSPSLFGLVDVAYFVAQSHFLDSLRGYNVTDHHDQNPPGYTYDRSRYLHELTGDSVVGDYDWIAQAYSYNTNPTRATRNRMDALCGGSCDFSKSKYDDDYQDVKHVSAASAAQALVDKFVATGDAKYLFRAMHYVEDASQPHHAGLYYGADHTDLEGYAQDNFYNPNLDISLSDSNIGLSMAWANYYKYLDAEDVVKDTSAYSAYTCPGVYLNDYTDVQDDCLEAIFPRIRGAVAGILIKAVNDRLN